MARIRYTYGMNLSIYDGNGEVNYYLLDEGYFSSNNNFRIAPNFRILSIDPVTMTTKIYVYLDFQSLNGYSGHGTASTAYMNGVALENHPTSIGVNSSVYMGGREFTIQHNSAGVGTLNINCSMSSAWGIGSASTNQNIKVNDIAVASTLSSYPASANVESSYNFTIASQSDSYYNLIQLYIPNGNTSSGAGSTTINLLSGVRTTNKILTSSITIPSNVYNYMYGLTNVSARFLVKTYSNSSMTTQIGETKTYSTTLYTTQDRCKPTVSGTVQAINYTSLTGSTNKIINGVTTVQVNATATPRNNAIISKFVCRNAGVEKSLASGVASNIENVSDGNFYIEAIDNRGYPGYNATYPISLEVIPYVPFTANLEAKRLKPTQSNILITITGIFWKGNFGNQENALGLIIKHKEKGASQWASQMSIVESAITFEDIYEDNVYKYSRYSYDITINDYDYRTACEIEIDASDLIIALNYSKIVTEGIPIIAFAKKLIETFGKRVFYKDNNDNVRIDDTILVGDTSSTLANITTNANYASGNVNAIINDFYYKSGDRMIIYTPGSSVLGKTIVSSYVSNASQEFGFSITTEKSMKNVTPSIENLGLNVRKSNGGYVGATGYTEGGVNFLAYGYTVYLNKINNNTIGILVRHNGAFNDITNNTPLSIEINYLQILFS